jgi:hypothetical protein
MNLILLYLGMAMGSVGMILVAMGTGDKDRMQGFLSSHLKMLGPIMVVSGGLLCVARIAFMFKPVGNMVGEEEEKSSIEDKP